MTRFFFVLMATIGLLSSAEAQNLMVEKAFELLKDKELLRSWQAINLATQHEETAQDARAWYVRSYVSKELFKADQVKNIDYAVEALRAADKSVTLAGGDKYYKDCEAIAAFVYTYYYNQAVAMLNQEHYEQALSQLRVLNEDASKLNKFAAEAAYLSGYAHLMTGHADSTRLYFSQALAAGHRDPLIYETLSSSYLEAGETGKARTMIDMGRILYSDDRGLQIAELNTLMKEKKYEKAAQATEDYLSSYKKDTEVMLLYGTIQGHLLNANPDRREAHFKKRVDIYEKVLKVDSNNLLANYNLGITYYNKGVELINNDEVFEKDIFEFDQLLNASAGLFQKALPYVLKANRIDHQNYNTLKALEGIYYSLNNQQQLDLVQNKLDALSHGGG